MTSEPEWRSIDDAAAYLGVTRRAIHKYIQQGKLPAFKSNVGGRTLLKLADLEAFKSPRPRE